MVRKPLVPAVIGVIVVMVVVATWRDARRPAVSLRPSITPIDLTTRDELAATVDRMERRLASNPADGDAVVRLAQASIRVQRINGDAAAVATAERRLRALLSAAPDHYDAQRMLGPVLLSQHRFRDAIREAERAREMDPADAFNDGVIGDASIELGDYDRAFAAFDRMGARRPGPPAYARVAYALELKGNVDAALESMRMAADGTSAHDAEGQAWHYAQLGHLLLQRGRLGDAKREFERAAFTFANHPYALAGLARVKIAEGDDRGALGLYQQLHARTPTPETAAMLGDLEARRGQADRAESYYLEAERLERDGWAFEEPQPQALARFFAERGRKIEEAVTLAEEAAGRRHDIFTMDALAWSYYQAGRLGEASIAADGALRTGTRDPRILYHAAAIKYAKGDAVSARSILERVSAPELRLDLFASDAAQQLMADISEAPLQTRIPSGR